MSDRRRAVGVGFVFTTLAVLLLALGGTWLVRRSFPRAQGVLQIPGLDAQVDIYRSADGVPHIYAATEHDLFFAQGYVHAQDRFWQMDFSRHVGSGRLAEMFGESQVETDAFLRTLGWTRLAEQELLQLDPEVIAILEAYAEGVNAYLDDRPASAISLEYVILGLLSHDYGIEPWTPVHTLTWAKVMAWDLGGNMDGEIDRSLLLTSLSPEQLEDLYPPYPSDHPVIVPGPGGQARVPGLNGSALPPGSRQDLLRARSRIESLNALLGARSPGIGSNSWVISGDLTESGAPILANDTHLGIQMPSIWYENGLHCRDLIPVCRFDVAGFSFAGVPSVIIGHNQHIAWGFTNAGPDVQDLFIERLNPDAPDQYAFKGNWREMTVREEKIVVAGGDPVPLTIRETHHGPLISETYGPLEDLSEASGDDFPGQTAVALRWTALEPSTLFEAVIRMNQASDWKEFRAAAQFWDVPSQNLVFADTEGNIGYQLPGKIPIRASGIGWMPIEGWIGEHEWRDYVPFAELPFLLNPPKGFIVTANNAVVDASYPYHIARSWDRGYRADRITTMIEAEEAITLADIRGMQGDSRNPMAEVMVPHLDALQFEDVELAERVDRLTSWDGQDHMDSAEAAFFNAIWRQLLNQTFFEEWEAGPMPTDDRSFAVMTRLLDRPDSPWWDLPSSGRLESRDDLLRLAVAEANRELENRLGPSMDEWRWGDLHTATFRNQSLGESGVAPIEALFNRGPFAVSGGASIVNATDWDPTESYEVTSLPSQRLIVDLSDLDGAQTIHTTGQSGHAFHPHYINLANRWRRLEYHRLPWSPEQVASGAGAHLRLEPEGR